MPKDNKSDFEETNMKDYEEQYEELLAEEKDKEKKRNFLQFLLLLLILFFVVLAMTFSFVKIFINTKNDPRSCTLNCDTDGDGVCDFNCDTNNDGIADLNVDLNRDGICDVNCDTNGDGRPDINLDYNGDMKPHFNIDTNGDGKPDQNLINQDTNNDGVCDVNCDTNGDNRPDTNIDMDNDGKPDINIDTNGDGTPDINIDTDGDGDADINIDTNGKPIRFDNAGNQIEGNISRIGILHLPKKYRSAYIIDGQHRLYGYANSQYKASNCIPVVAFINLERTQQVKLFMQINENQKAVPKNLRNTLNSDLLWNSEDRNEQIKALKLQIALSLGEELHSPLYDRIIIGENIKSATRCITIDTIKIGLDRGNFFGTFDKNSIKTDGTFYKGNNDATFDKLFPFIISCFNYIKDNLPEEWSKGDADGFLTINANIESLLRIFSDIIDHIVKTKGVNPKMDSTQNIMQETCLSLWPKAKI